MRATSDNRDRRAPASKRTLAWCAILALPALLAGCSDSSRQDAESAPPTLTILQTGRLRGNIYPSGVQRGTAPLQYHPILAGYIKQTREEAEANGGEVILVDLGDSLTGSFGSYVTGSENVVRFFNGLDYDAIVLGNLDADVDPAILEQLDVPAANPFVTTEGEPAAPFTKLRVAFTKAGLPVELIANFYGDGDPAEFPERFPVSFGGHQNVQPARDYKALLGQAFIKPEGTFRLFSWMKFESPKDAPAAYLANLRELGVDVVLAHRVYSSKQREVWSKEDPYIAWSPPVAQNILRDNRGFVLSRLDLRRDPDGWKVLNHELVPMVANLAEPDSTIEEVLAPLAPAINEADEVVIELEQSLDRQAILERYMQALAQFPEVDAVLYSSESIRGEWSRGPLRTSRVFDSLPWSSKVVTIQMDRAQWDEVIDSQAFATLTKPAIPEAGPIRIATSEFFARILSKQVALNLETMTTLTPKAEFMVLNDHLKTTPAEASISEEGNDGVGR